MKKLNVALAAGLALALVGAALVLLYGRNVSQRIADGKRTVAVLVADSVIPTGASLAEVAAHTHVARIPSAYVVHDPLADLTALSSTGAGATQFSAPSAQLELLAGVTSGEQLSKDLFGVPNSASTVKAAPGHVAVAVDADITPGVARYVSAGSTVDIFVTYKSVGSAAGTAASPAASMVNQRTKLFMSAVKVLSVSVAQTTTKASATSTTTLADKVVTVLDVSPTDAEKVINAAQLGDLYFALNTGAAHTTATGATPADVITSNR